MRSIVLFSSLVLLACATGTAQTPVTLQVPGRANAHVSLAADGQFVVAAWASRLDSRSDVHVAVSRDGGRTFGEPVRVNTIEGEAAVGGERPPRVAISPEAGKRTIAVLWSATTADGTVIRLAESRDGGLRFAPPRQLNAGDARGLRSWGSLSGSGAGVWHAAWLDGRAAAASKPSAGASHVHHQHGSGARPAGAPRQNLYYAAIGPDGTVRETLAAENVCFCCKTATLASADGTVWLAWRHIFTPGERDIAVARLDAGSDRFAAPVRVSHDRWRIDACPDDGPALAVDGEGRVHVVWPTLVDTSDPAKGIFHAVSADGRTFGPRQRIDGGSGIPSHPQIAVQPSGAALIVWDESVDGKRRVMMAAPGASAKPVVVDEGTYPAVAASDGGFVIAWTSADGQAVRVRRIEKGGVAREAAGQ
ncbi:MAG TPA: sialidase family protein [Vicinamibacterales bacterium]